ncbi:MAG TPA: MAPEG family protein [Steroidobacteraceae bacterium]|nr:MAPEG family protein [Steroidobacteraceae bacterium]
MKTEILYLTYVAVLTGVLWIPYILNEIVVRGLSDAVGYPENPKPLAPWAERMKKAHYNAVENLVVFAALVLVANALGVSDPATQMCAVVYFWARVVHAAAYTFAIPWIRTLAFATGWGAQMCIAWQILAH